MIIQFSRYREFNVEGWSCFYDRHTKKYYTIVNSIPYEYSSEKELRAGLKKMCG